MQDNTIALVTVILAVGSVVVPLLFGYVMWRMSQVFVTRPEFEAFQKSYTEDKAMLDARLAQIDYDLKELLQRTASQR